jgi:hypothetical protein
MQGRMDLPICRRLFAFVASVVCFSPAAEAQFNVERKFAQGTDASAHHLFLLNPATVMSAGLETDVLIGRGTYATSFESDRSANLNEVKSDGQDDVLAAGLLMDVGAGLSIGINHLRSFHRSATTDSNVQTPREEGRAGQLTMARAVVEISQNLRLGITVRHFQVEENVLGAIYVQPTNNTVYRGTLFGTGGGLHLSLGDFCFGLAYHPPLKGKTEIYGEEKIITDPGISEGTAALTRGAMTFGLSVRRNIYKHDDRIDGTTLNDNNQTEINLFGLDPEETTIFFLDHYQAGFDLKISDKTTSRISIAKETVEFNFALQNDLPGENPQSQRYSYYKISGGILLKASRFVLNLGANFALKDHEFDRGNDNHYHYQSQGRDLFAMVSTGI